ncbi:MAG: 50S ribosomal protein L18 [Coxiellaceae bacterium]|nr:50S ribosomal protein L18 [Coxiellaceae bacterium]
MKNKKILSRIRRAKSSRLKYRELDKTRLCVHRTLNHIYAQIISPDGGKVLASASTSEKAVKDQAKYGGNIKAATVVGGLIAKRALEAGIKQVAFDRSGYKYHGRVKALADAAREGGIEF